MCILQNNFFRNKKPVLVKIIDSISRLEFEHRTQIYYLSTISLEIICYHVGIVNMACLQPQLTMIKKHNLLISHFNRINYYSSNTDCSIYNKY